MIQRFPLLLCKNSSFIIGVSSLLLITLVASFLDVFVVKNLGRSTGDFFYKLGTFAEYLGGYHIQPLMLLILASYPNRRRLFMGYGAVLCLQALIIGAIKIIVGRARPSLEYGAFYFSPFDGLSGDYESFPSGDAGAAMALAMLLGRYFPRSRWGFLLLGGCACMGRLVRGRHFLSDVVFGGGVGILLSLVIMTRLGKHYFTLDASEE